MKEPQRSSLTQLGVRPLEGVCHAPHSHPSSNEEQTSERSDNVSPLSNGRLCAGACEKIPRKFAHNVGLFNKITIASFVCALTFVPRTPPTRNRFRPRGRLWRPLVFPCINLCPRPKPFWVRGAWWWYVLWLHQASLGLQPGTMSGSWYQVPGARHYIREHSSIYARECKVYIGVRASHVCYVLVLHMNIHIFIPGTRCAFVVVVVYADILSGEFFFLLHMLFAVHLLFTPVHYMSSLYQVCITLYVRAVRTRYI